MIGGSTAEGPGPEELGLKKYCVAIGLSALLAVLPVAGAALAFDLFGWRPFGGGESAPEADVIGDPQPYEVTVEIQGADNEIGERVRASSRLWSDREKPASGAAGLIAKARSDYRRILAGLYTLGRYGGTISITIDGREATTLAADAPVSDPARVAILVDPGPLYRFGRIALGDPPPRPADRGDSVALPSQEGLAAGEPAYSGAVLAAERLLIEAWRQQGHAKARIARRSVTADHARDLVHVAVVVDPGSRAVYGPVSVRGAERMEAAFIARQTGLRPGDVYDPDDLERAGERLNRLGVFRAQTFEEGEAIGADGTLPITVVVEERKLRRIGLGATYSTIDGVGFNAFWLHRNLFGQAESLRLEGSVAGLGETLDYEEFDYSLGATYTQPGTFTPDTDLAASVLGKRQVLDSYTETSAEGRLGVKHLFSKQLTGALALGVERSQFDDDLGTRDFLTAGLAGRLTRDTRDTANDATRGYLFEATAEPFYEFEYANAAVRGTVEARAYYGFSRDDRLVLAGRAKIGSLAGADIAELPPDRLFFAGGGGSVRGYAYQGIGVERDDGSRIGGRSLLEASVELRARITDSIGAVVFADAGTVSKDAFPGSFDDVKVGVGGGLRYYTGLGPIRLDAALPLDPGPDDPDFAVYIGIGQAF